MKKLIAIAFFGLISFVGFSQDVPAGQAAPASQETSIQEDSTSEEALAGKKNKYFISTNSGIQSTPVGFRIGVLDRKGGYIGARFGKGDVYDQNDELTHATIFAINAGLIFPIIMRSDFKLHTFWGLGYGQWFERPSKSGQRMGLELEGGLMITYQKLMVTFGGNMLTGDGSSPKKDITIGVGYRF